MEKYEEIINKEVKPEARPEAINIMSKASATDLQDFYSLFDQGKTSMCLCVIDSVKQKLVKDGVLEQKDEDHFGHTFFDDDF